MTQEHKFETPAEVLAFMFAGNAIFTYRSQKTGTRFTYKVSMADKKEGQTDDVFFVNLLSGPDNMSDYTYIGMIKNGKFFATKASKKMEKAPSFLTFQWALAAFYKNVSQMPAQLEVWHVGRCGRCGRVLTVPESVATGIGPDCAAQMGREQVQLAVNPTTASKVPADLPKKPVQSARRTFAQAKAAVSGRAVAEAILAPAVAPVSRTSSDAVEARVQEYKANEPENYYQDGMLDEEEAHAVAFNKFAKEMGL